MGRGRRNARWQAYYDSLWYFYVTRYDQTPESRHFRKFDASGARKARQMAKALTYNPEVKRIVLYSSVKSRKAGRAEKFVWTREKGWVSGSK